MARPTRTSLGLALGTRPGTPILPALTGTPKIMATGDSTTAGTNSTDLGAYRTPLSDYLDDAGMAYEWVGPTASPVGFAHFGVSSREIAGLDADIAAKLTTYVPDIVLLLIGRNDMDDGTQAAAAPAAYATLLATMYAARPTARIVACHITPEDNTTFFTRTLAFRAALPAVLAASDYYADGLLIECRGGKSLAPLSRAHITDGVHPGDHGYVMVADDIWPSLRLAYGLAPLF